MTKLKNFESLFYNKDKIYYRPSCGFTDCTVIAYNEFIDATAKVFFPIFMVKYCVDK